MKKNIIAASLSTLILMVQPAFAHEKAAHAKPAAVQKKEQKDWGIAGDKKAVTRIINVNMRDTMRFEPDKLTVKLTKEDYQALSMEFGLPIAAIKTVVSVESGGKGFDEFTEKIIIQFEPVWFKRKAPYTPSGKWSLNRVERQTEEWKAFNDAFSKNYSRFIVLKSNKVFQK